MTKDEYIIKGIIDEYIINGIKNKDIALYDVFSGTDQTIEGNSIVGDDGEWFNLDEFEIELNSSKNIAYIKDKKTGEYVEGNNGEPFWFQLVVRNLI